MIRLLEKLNFKRATDGRYFKRSSNFIIEYLHDGWNFYLRGKVVFHGNETESKEYLKTHGGAQDVNI